MTEQTREFLINPSKAITTLITILSLLVIVYQGVSFVNSGMHELETTKSAILRIESSIERSEIRDQEYKRELALKFKGYDDRMLELYLSIKELQTMKNMENNRKGSK